jgi:histone-lysine N-methyltransferase SUV39H
MKKFKKMLARVPGPPIDIKNEVDLCLPPGDFFYISEVIYGQGVAKPDASFLVGCACYVADEDAGKRKGCCFDGDCLWLANSGQPVAYNKDALLLPGVTVIYECNSRCCCTIFSQPCRNRVIQQGRKVSLTIFRHGGPRGWGVRANHDIPRGTFIDVYLGEVITTREANARFKRAQATKKYIEASYLFDLDFNYDSGQESEFTLDAFRYGNVTHFINHSCDPNLRVCPCFTESQDARMHSLAFFACKDIGRGEELTFDYLGNNASSASNGAKAGKEGDKLSCLCGAAKCRKFIYK